MQELKGKSGVVEEVVYRAAANSIDYFAVNVENQIDVYHQLEFSEPADDKAKEHDVGLLKLTKLIGAANALNQFNFLYCRPSSSYKKSSMNETLKIRYQSS